MWAIIPVRWTSTPATALWSAAEFERWLDPTIPYSLGHALAHSTFGQADLTRKVFSPVVMDDPRMANPPPDVPKRVDLEGRPDRSLLINTALEAVSKVANPNWDDYSQVMVWYAQTDPVGGSIADTFASGKYCVLGKLDVFATSLHEALHSLGFQHSWRDFVEYEDPYDAMSAARYSSRPVIWSRPGDSRLPQAMFGAQDQNARVGPLLSPAHLCLGGYRDALVRDGFIWEVPTSYLTSGGTFRLVAHDLAAAGWPQKLGQVVAEMPSTSPVNDRYFLELRRPAGYDRELRMASPASADPVSDPPPAGVVIHEMRHLFGSWSGLRYEGVLPLVERGDLDFRVLDVESPFVLELVEVGPNQEWVDVRVGPTSAKPRGRLDLALDVTADEPIDGIERDVWVKPCFAAPVMPHRMEQTLVQQHFTLTATSRGYEVPGYLWTVNGVPVPATAEPGIGLRDSGTMAVAISAQRPDAQGSWQRVSTMAQLTWEVDLNVLRLTCSPFDPSGPGNNPLGNFHVTVEARVVETDPGVVKTPGMDATTLTSFAFDSVRVTWDGDHRRWKKRCAEMLWEVTRKRIPILEVGPPELVLPYIQAILKQLVRQQPSIALDIVDELSKRSGVEAAEIRAYLLDR